MSVLPCRHGRHCPRLVSGTCRYAHTDHERQALLVRERLEPCAYGLRCRYRETCLRDHQSTTRPCRRGEDCADARCTYGHPQRRQCPVGWDCREIGCTYRHPTQVPEEEMTRVHQLVSQVPREHWSWNLYLLSSAELEEYLELLQLRQMAECPLDSDEEHDQELARFEESLGWVDDE